MAEEKESESEERSLLQTPTWAVATVLTFLVCLGLLVHGLMKKFGKWLDKTKKKSLLAAFVKIEEELMMFGILSLLMGHWIEFVAKICVKHTELNSPFLPCTKVHSTIRVGDVKGYANDTLLKEDEAPEERDYCPEGKESFASYESLEQLHHLIFVLGLTHVFYSFVAVALSLTKIYGWRKWENQAKTLANQSSQDATLTGTHDLKMRRHSTFIIRRVSHPWSQHRVLVWLLCFSRQFWNSINRADYMALRLGFITTHQLPLTYDFHNYMIRSMDDEFRDIVGISVPLWIYGILCVILDFHGTNVYFWLSFLPAILILLIGMKLHRVVVKLAIEILDNSPWNEHHKFNLRDELFWFGKPKFVLQLIQLISFQNSFEMASFIWSLWEIKDPSCFMENEGYMVTRLIFGVVTQCWCSSITFPQYVLIKEMGSRFKRTVISEDVRESLSKWKNRARARHDGTALLERTTSSLSSKGGRKRKGFSSDTDYASILRLEGYSPRARGNVNEDDVPLWVYLQEDDSTMDEDQKSQFYNNV